ncbi:3',5'-cyclic-nucleotide phosphodiesterase [Luteibacter aegosomatissinici]|uniref:3',5'-cyclic-nucleotide phosphodiesterase n=1 Tax=Luteibacter aegosomatissinici TaxID=2911539 RepID=UPI001FFA402B|nr:3',5'-cyclic-nucleotide phosphodiesterase [Luteibacter aegosomatissinici]UPG94595.1 3',5'-cyclic-nucleotide phosphodiesterase [Luteibacter aegosomatissinici]
MTSLRRAFAALCLATMPLATQAAEPPRFEVVALGVGGGVASDNLSGYLIRAAGDDHYLALDAGTLVTGIDKARATGALKGTTGYILHQGIAAYFISHGHLDHVAGLVIASPEDHGDKLVYGLPSTLDVISRDYFNWEAWPNLADRGKAPALGWYHLTDEAPGAWFAVQGTSMSAQLWPLSHDAVVSSMILLRAGGDYYAYFGDTGPDALSHGKHDLAEVWQALAPLVRSHALKGIQIEVSFPNDVPDAKLFGHLTPTWLLRELQVLAEASGGKDALRGLTVVVDHIKPSLDAGRDPRALVRAQLATGNTLGVRFVEPAQGERLVFP